MFLVCVYVYRALIFRGAVTFNGVESVLRVALAFETVEFRVAQNAYVHDGIVFAPETLNARGSCLLV